MKSILVKVIGLLLVVSIGYVLWVLVSHDTENPYGRKELSEESRGKVRKVQVDGKDSNDIQRILDRVVDGGFGIKPISATDAASMTKEHLRRICSDQSIDFSVFDGGEIIDTEKFMWLFKYSSSDPNFVDYFVAIDKYGKVKAATDVDSID